MSRQNELLGRKCRDKLTGYIGVCHERIIWMFGCDKYALHPLFEEGKDYNKILPRTFAEDAIEVIETIVEVDPDRDELGNQERFFGKLCRDKVTLFEGICTGRLTSLYGSDMYCLAQRSKKKKASRDEWFDEARIEIIGDGVAVDEVKGSRPGGENSYPSFDAEYAAII